MPAITIDGEVQRLAPQAQLGVIEARGITVTPHDPIVWTMLDELCERLRTEYGGKAAADRAEVAATRRAYRALGDDPTRYRPANEALLRRVLSGAALPQINTLVDLNNYVSLSSGWAIGSYDADRIAGAITLRRGADGEQYAPIGKPAVGAARRLVLADDQGIFGSPTADAQRTMVTEMARDLLLVIFTFESERSSVEQAVDQAAQFVTRFCSGTIGDRQVVGSST